MTSIPRSFYTVNATKPDGSVVSNATVLVTGRSIATPINVYADSSTLVAMASPIVTDASGRATFWVTSQSIDVTVNGAGFVSWTDYPEMLNADWVVNTLGGTGVSPFLGYATPLGGIRPDYATPLVGIPVNYAKRAEYATPLVGVSVDYAKRAEYATPLVGVSIDYAKRAEYATPVGVSTGSLAYLNQDESFTGLTTFATPVRISASGTGLTVAGSIAGNSLSLVGGATLGANLGIGTTTPIFPLDVSGYGRFSTPILVTSTMVLIQPSSNLKLQGSNNYWQLFVGNSGAPLKAGGLLLAGTFTPNLPSPSIGQAQILGEVSIGAGATPVSGINFNVLGKSSLWTATPLKDPALEVVGLVTATPGIRFSDGTTQITAFTAGAFTGYATPINTLAYSTPVNVNANTVFTVTHNLNTRDVSVQCYDTMNFEAFDPYVQRDTVNTVRVKLSSATPISTYRIVVKG